MRTRLTEVAELLRVMRRDAEAIGQHESLRIILRQEQDLVERTEDLVTRVRHAREVELQRFWPGVWRRWAAAVMLVVIAALAAGAGYGWAGRPSGRELERLRASAEFGDAVVRRLGELTTQQRRQFDALMQQPTAPAR